MVTHTYTIKVPFVGYLEHTVTSAESVDTEQLIRETEVTAQWPDLNGTPCDIHWMDASVEEEISVDGALDAAATW